MNVCCMLTDKSNPLLPPVAAVLSAVAVMAGCTSQSEKESAKVELPVEEEYHADNDIAMTVRSLADAIRVGESLDSADYNFEGVLTDGQGAPLYTDVTGNPGEWQITVTGEGSAKIRNLYLGDILPDDLRNYVAESMHLNDTDITESFERDPEDGGECLTVYDFGGGSLRFESRPAMAPNGLEGLLVSILIVKD